jgi:hypothetical protein
MAIVASVLVGLGFVCFAADELGRGSKNQQRELAQTAAPRRRLARSRVLSASRRGLR